MSWAPRAIVDTLDACCDAFTFPMLDNGYVYLAASRLSLYRSQDDWAMVIEVFGFSPRSGVPDTQIYTFGSRVLRAKSEDQYVSRQAYINHLESNPHNESAFVFPIEEGGWQDAEDNELMSAEPHAVVIRGEHVAPPMRAEYSGHHIDLQDSSGIRVFEFCRLLASCKRESVLATPEERGIFVPAGLTQILQVEAWRHPDLLSDERPSSSEAFEMFARVLSDGNASQYRPVEAPNTHWINWPEGGSL